MTDHLTLTLGLRYEAHTPWVEANDQQSELQLQRQARLSTPTRMEPAAPSTMAPTAARTSSRALALRGHPEAGAGRLYGFRGAFTDLRSYLEGTGTNLRLPLNPPYDGGAAAGGEFQTLYTRPVAPRCPTDDEFVAGHYRAAANRTFLPEPFLLHRRNLPSLGRERAACYRRSGQPDNPTSVLGNSLTFQVGYVGQVAYHLMVPFKYNQLVAEPDSSCSTPPCTSPSLYFQNGIGPQLASMPLTRPAAPCPARSPTAE